MPKLPKYIRNSGKPWTDAEIDRLEKLAEQDTPTPVIGLKLGRTPAAIYTRASPRRYQLTATKPTSQTAQLNARIELAEPRRLHLGERHR